MDKPCLKECKAYDEPKNQCRIMEELQELRLDKRDRPEERDDKLVRIGANVDKLLTESKQYPCNFQRHIEHCAYWFLDNRGLDSQYKDDVTDEVGLALMKMDYGRLRNP